MHQPNRLNLAASAISVVFAAVKVAL